MEWRFINSEMVDGYTNMAIDESIMKCYSDGERKPTLRIYGWNPPAVSIGYFQTIENAVNIQACKDFGIDIVRRLTGGRAVLHEHEITYSIIIEENYPKIPKSIVESYKFLCKGILRGLKLAGADVSLESGKKNIREVSSQACFDSPSTYEIVCEGKKLVGSAQVRKNGIILQHGSILVDIDVAKHSSVLARSKKEEQVLAQILEKKTISLKQILGGEIKNKNISDLLFKGYCEELGIIGQFSDLYTEEKLLRTELVKKYSSGDWTFFK